MEPNQIYFFTASIFQWKNLLKPDKYKQILIGSLKYLVIRRKVNLYGFVLMPNHIHLIWEMIETNGKEMPNASFMKFTSHAIQKDLKAHHSEILKHFEVNNIDRKYQFWQRDAMSFHLYTPEVVYQKLDYLHNNPCQGKWMLANCPLEYKYSSASFYETGIDIFSILTHVGTRL